MISMRIGKHEIGEGLGCFILAEAGVNHNGSLAQACALVDAAVEAGADAVKFQTFTAEKLVLPDTPQAQYQRRASQGAESQLEMLKGLELSRKDHQALVEHCRKQGIPFLSTPFDEDSADFLESLGVEAFKIGSGDLTNVPLLEHVARKGRPMIVSTGMSTLGEVEAAVTAIETQGDPALVLLHCVSNYPAAPRDANLRAMATLRLAFGCPVGYSDHTMGIEVPLAAAALGACVIEKHFTLDRGLPGPDHQASMEPREFKRLVQGIRLVEAAMGDGRKRPVASEADVLAVARRSLVAAVAIPKGTALRTEMLALRRPGTGLPADMRRGLVGRRASVDIPAGTLLQLKMFR
jgi:N-acetylneuraminate synthase